jgi:hypothetical protein
MVKKKKGPNRNTFAKGALRRASLMWGPISECRRLARRERGKYECAMCHELFGPKEVQVDHIDPVIDIIKGWESWDTYIARLFCDLDGLACLCKTCHESKTAAEVQMRKYARAKRKEENTEHDEDEE